MCWSLNKFVISTILISCQVYTTSSLTISGGLNLSSSEPPDNRTIQNFVKTFVDVYVGA